MSDTTINTPQLITGENDTIDTRATTTTSDTTTDATKTAKKVCPPHSINIIDYCMHKHCDYYFLKCSICSLVNVIDLDYSNGNLYRFVKFKYNWRYSKMFKCDSHQF